MIEYLRMLLLEGWQNSLPNNVQLACATVGSIIILLLLGTGFLILLVNNRSERKFLGTLAVIVSVTGLSLYFIGYISVEGTGLAQAVLHAIFSTIRMFIGEEDYGWFDASPGSIPAKGWFVILFWLTHLLAMFLSSSVALTIFGKGLYQRMKLRFGIFHNRIHIIFGVTNQSLFYGESLLKTQSAGKRTEQGTIGERGEEEDLPENDRRMGNHRSNPLVIYFDSDVSQDLKDRIFEMGAVLHHQPLLEGGEVYAKAMRPLGLKPSRYRNHKTLSSVLLSHLIMQYRYPRWKKYRFYLFSKDDELNLMMVRSILKYLAQTCVPVDRVRVLMLSENARHHKLLQELRTDKNAKGILDTGLRLFGGNRESGLKAGAEALYKIKDQYDNPCSNYQVSMFSESDIASAELFRKKPIRTILGLQNGKQTKPFAMMIFGAGEVGIAVLRRAIAQGQFERLPQIGDSEAFRIVVIDKEADLVEARFRLYYPEAVEKYNVEFVKDDAYGSRVMEKLLLLADNLKYIVIALEDDKTNTRVARDLSDWFARESLAKPVIAIHIRDEERHMEKHANAILDEDNRFIRFGAFRDVFSAQEMFGAKSRRRLLRAVLLKKLYDTVYDIRTKVIEDTTDRMVHLLKSDKGNAIEDFLDEFRTAVDKEMERFSEYFSSEIPNEPEQRKAWLKEQYREFYNDTLFSQMSNIAAAENLEVYLNEKPNQSHYINEHLRWTAFHRVHGWRAMSSEELTERAGAFYSPQLQQCLDLYHQATTDEERCSAIRRLNGLMLEDKPIWRFRFQKDEKTMRHACITDWEKLDRLDETETGFRVDLYNAITKALDLLQEEYTETTSGEKNPQQENLCNEVRILKQNLLGFLSDIPYYKLCDKVFVDNAGKIYGFVRELERFNS